MQRFFVDSIESGNEAMKEVGVLFIRKIKL